MTIFIIFHDHYQFDGDVEFSPSEGGDPESLVKKKKTKRMRTTFTEEQIQILQVDLFSVSINFSYYELQENFQINIILVIVVIIIHFGQVFSKEFQANFQIDSNPDGQDLERYFFFFDKR